MSSFFGTRNGKIIGVILLIILLAAIPLTIFVSQQEQDIRQRASETACKVESADVILVIDNSNSMAGGKLNEAKEAAQDFVNTIMADPTDKNRVGIATFDNNGGLNLELTSIPSTVLNTIRGLTTPGDGKGGTCLECALDKVDSKGPDVKSAFANTLNPPNKRHVIILTDGKINRYMSPEGNIKGDTSPAEEQKAREQAEGAVNRILTAFPNTAFSVIQYGGESNKNWLTGNIVKTPGTYQGETTNQATLRTMYKNIAIKLLGGTIKAFVYGDTNADGAVTNGESGMVGVKVKLSDKNDSSKVTEKDTDATGYAIFTNACSDKQYVLTVVPPEGMEGSPTTASLTRDVPPVAENQTVTENFGLKKSINASSLVCDPTEVTVTGDVQTVKATLKDKDGNPLANKTIIWKPSTNDIIILTPTPGGSQPATQSSPQL